MTDSVGANSAWPRTRLRALHRAPARTHDAQAYGAPWWAIRTCVQLHRQRQPCYWSFTNDLRATVKCSIWRKELVKSELRIKLRMAKGSSACTASTLRQGGR